MKRCKDCSDFEVFKYGSHGLCRSSMKHRVLRSNQTVCPYYVEKPDVVGERKSLSCLLKG
jgi:hypothetical protein